jgi:hypothetical protein
VVIGLLLVVWVARGGTAISTEIDSNNDSKISTFPNYVDP